MKFMVSCSEGPSRIVAESEVRAAIHELFCSCGMPANCDNEYLADFDTSDEKQFRDNGAYWDLEDGWVSIDPEP